MSTLTHICIYVCMHALYTRVILERRYFCLHLFMHALYTRSTSEREDAHVFSFLVWFHYLNYTFKFILLSESFMNSSLFFFNLDSTSFWVCATSLLSSHLSVDIQAGPFCTVVNSAGTEGGCADASVVGCGASGHMLKSDSWILW